jgi:hypothetical protein
MLSVWLLAQPLVSSPSRQLEVAAAPLMQRASSVVLVAAVTQQGIFAALWPARSMMMLQPSTGAISDVGVSPTSAHAHGVVLRTSVFFLVCLKVDDEDRASVCVPDEERDKKEPACVPAASVAAISRPTRCRLRASSNYLKQPLQANEMNWQAYFFGYQHAHE